MAEDERDAFMDALTVAMQKQGREQHSDDIITFLKDHWKWFFYRRKDMVDLVDQMGNQFPATVDAFCDQLGVPETVWFKRANAADLRQLFATFETSRIRKTFMTCVEKSASSEACLVLVAGKSSMCVTNMQTQYPAGSMICYYKSTGDLPDIHLFKADEIPARLPNLFTQQGE